VNKDELLTYCEQRDIFVPAGAPKSAIEAAIVKAAYHLKSANRDNCFGFWKPEHGSCLVCALQSDCSSSTLGMPTDRYLRAVERLENPKIRTTERLTNGSVGTGNKRSVSRKGPKRR